MWWRVGVLALLVTAVAGKGKKLRHQKPGRAVLDLLSSATIGEVISSSEISLLPVPLDVASFSVVTTNATCGQHGAEEFCRETAGKRNIVCDVCEGPEGSSSRRHPASLAVDGDPDTWWQSPVIIGDEYQHVDLVAMLTGKMELLHVIIKAGPSPRPLAWSLEVSSTETGEDWRLVRAFGDRDHCRKLWDLRPERRRRKVRGIKRTSRAEKASCSTQFTSPKPLENGEMHVGIGEGVPARRVRISFRAAHSPARHSYYTVRELTLAARCICHGHAEHCTVDHKSAKCNCMHATCGVHCQRCCSGGLWRSHQPCAGHRDDVGHGDHEGSGDQGCSCGGRGACSYDDSGAILCVNCTENRAGPLCDRCLDGFYNVLPDDPCLPCDCDAEGSEGSCKWDRKHHQVKCVCREGFTGHKCDSCDNPDAVFPNCLADTTTPACECDPRGVVDPSRACDEGCDCKANVVGERCDACAAGHFGPHCLPCYCSRLSSHCTTDDSVIAPVSLPLGEAWSITDAATEDSAALSVDEQGKPYLITYEVEGWESYYFVSTAYSGDRASVYGGQLAAAVAWAVARGDSGGSATRGPDLLLLGADGTKLTYGNSSYETPGLTELKAVLMEDGWYLGSDPVSRFTFLDVLSDLKAIMIRAHFHYDQDEVRLEAADITPWRSDVRERCACPLGHTGAQCGACADTHVRVQRARGVGPAFECVPCACNGHASCSTVDGACGACRHNTSGPRCERCLPGHYGNPVTGACKPCACPLYEPSNNFSPNCALASAEGDAFVCTQCPDGYAGDHCELCESGYWGAPTEAGGGCAPCQCGGGPCHARSGRCLRCPPHAEGDRCAQCQEGYWWRSGRCAACACGAGALSAACDVRGRCACRRAWAGRACSSCAAGHGGVSEGCPPCACGAAVSPVCEPESGACVCLAGAAPPRCTECLSEYYGLSETGCLGCNCSSLGAENNVCDIRTGQCRCRPHVTGRACDTCEEGYWGLEQGGCRRCECDAGAAACDPVNGTCACSVGVGGRRCDRCLPGYYGFGPNGCLSCPTCTDGRVCSPITGRCVCPARTRGAGCQQCARGYWGRTLGCRPCSCGRGSLSDSCDAVSGQCQCRHGWTGPDCSGCSRGFFGPKCRPCGCLLAGTKNCEGGVCACGQNGQCPCKENVVGSKCDSCLDGTFGLSAANPAGCTACFCFGRSAKCSQAAVARAALHQHHTLHLTLSPGSRLATEREFLSVRTSVQEATVAVPSPATPVYAELGELFLGDHVLSYGGALYFRVEEEGGQPLPPHVIRSFPLVSIHGNNIVLDYYERMPAVNGSHVVHLHESLWEVRETREGAWGTGGVGGLGGVGDMGMRHSSRGELMLGLLDVRRLLLRLSTRAPNNEAMHVLLLNVTLETAVAGLSRGAPALGVERCLCPRGYAAASCQRPAPGYWAAAAAAAPGDLLPPAAPCDCGGRATACHPHTGHCLNCTMNTSGPHCERCAEGYYGREGDCRRCPCPAHAGCALVHGRPQCYCTPGYTGAQCASCAGGWRRAGGACVPCQCDARGSVSAQCTPRCQCAPHAAGDDCGRCVAPRHYLDDAGCKPCDNCTQTLLDSIEGLTSEMHKKADVTELSLIPQPFPALREFSSNTTKLRDDLHSVKKILEKSKDLEHSISNLEETEHELFTNANKLKIEATNSDKEALSLSSESMTALEVILQQKRILAEEIAKLDEFARGEKHLSAHRALKEARHLLQEIKEINLIDYIAGVTDVTDSANLQSKTIHRYQYRIEDAVKRIQKVQSRLEQWERKADDLSRLSASVWAVSDHFGEVKSAVTPKLLNVRDIGLRCRMALDDISKLSTLNLTERTRSDILHTQNLAVSFPSLLSQLKNLTAAAEEKEGILYNLTPRYKEKYLDAVEKHVALLGEKAKEYKNLFAGTRALASAGVTAAHAWGEVWAGVRDAGSAATAAAATAAAAATTARGPQPLLATADRLRGGSRRLSARGGLLLETVDELRHQLQSAQHKTDAISVSLRALGWKERSLGGAAGGLGGNGGAVGGLGGVGEALPVLRQASAQAERVFGSARALYDEAAETRRKVRYQLRRNLAALQRLGDTALGAAEEHVSQIRSATVRGEQVAGALAAAARARALQHAAAAPVLRPRLAALDVLVRRARHAATTVSVSVSSPAAGAGCARAFPGWSAPAATRLALTLTFDGALRDGTLLYLPDQQETGRYVRLGVEGGRLVARWDVGGGGGQLLHPAPLAPARDDDHTTYRILFERVWGTVKLKVERSGAAAVTSTNTTDTTPGSGLLQPSLWWLGEESNPLPACVHSLHVDHTPIGLWAFSKQPANSKCTGCTQRWYSAGAGAGAGVGLAGGAWLGGAGYVSLRRSRTTDRRHFTLSFTFRTTDTDALLFLAHDWANNRSVSVWLRECRVVFAVQYGGARLHIAAGARHCDGRPAHVQATRVFNGLERGSLRVNGEETLGSPSPPVQSAAALPELSSSAYWLGGIPPEGEGLGYDMLPLMGCLGGVMVDREGYDLLDTPTRYGVEPGCNPRPLRSAVLEGEGYIEVASPSLRRRTSLSLSFRARASSGVLVYRAPVLRVEDNEVEEDDDHHYLVLVLDKGELELTASAGKSELKLRVNGTKFDDGALHTVQIVRAHKQVELWVDEKQVGSSALPGGAFPARPRGLFLGGVPPGTSLSPHTTVGGFTGTIADFIVDSTWVGLDTRVRAAGARVGRAEGGPPPPRRAPPTDRCAQMSSYTVEAGAVKFGDGVHSHAWLKTERSKELSITLQIRTFATDGLLLLVPGSKLKPKHYTAVWVRGGGVRLAVRGRRRRQLALTGRVDDGRWHQITIRITRSRMTLSCGDCGGSSGGSGSTTAGRAPPHSRAARLFLGSPPPALVPHVPNAVLRLGAFVGCVRRVSVNGRTEDLVRDARAHAAVGQCFPAVERGAHFAGDAYAEWSLVGVDGGGGAGAEGDDGEAVEVRLQFRAAAGDGVLAAAAGALLELKDGFVVVSTATQRLESRLRVCDGRWHSAHARLSRAAAALALDAGPEERAPPSPAPPPALAAPPPPPPLARALYVGGLPEGATDLAEGRQNFKGCIRDVVVAGSHRDWRHSTTLHNVLLDSCPVT